MDGYPMLNIISMADSKRSEPSTGEIYFLLTNLDFVGQDILKNNKLTMLFTQDQDLECTKNGIDTMEPTCARIIISGSVVKVRRLCLSVAFYCLAKNPSFYFCVAGQRNG